MDKDFYRGHMFLGDNFSSSIVLCMPMHIIFTYLRHVDAINVTIVKTTVSRDKIEEMLSTSEWSFDNTIVGAFDTMVKIYLILIISLRMQCSALPPD